MSTASSTCWLAASCIGPASSVSVPTGTIFGPDGLVSSLSVFSKVELSCGIRAKLAAAISLVLDSYILEVHSAASILSGDANH